ncbi:polyprenol monophosphomannose synthase [Glaciihabitans sp. INWT7]|uniref:polyprenol monophosphomannose synthase n=1 Tax=Glaciihabitans sp. INWT7 TaxID=2596912 RepID=UPI0016281491|nr:polyprenol monophosphomannose synthase [Glaciihabitans sp. INWT7]QNE46687.1 polyprenol monophosphomannose synthase [Glaciihabitans sp. INWT7]
MAETLIILPTYNEIESLETVLGRIRQAVPQADVLVVDDSSPDGTGRLADRLAAVDPGISVLHRAAKQGLGQAYLAGFARALEHGYRFVVEMDADGSHDPSALPAMIDLAAGGADLVIGSRWVHGGSVRNWPWIRQVISRAGNAYSRAVLRSGVHDITAGFRVYRADALRSLELSSVSSQGYCFQVELAWRLEREGRRVVEHPIVFIERAAGRSKMHFGIVVEALLRVTLWGVFGPGSPQPEQRQAEK